MNNLKHILEPKSIAVIGVSETKGTVGYAIFSNLILSGFTGTVFPVNPKYKEIMSIKAYSSVEEVPDTIDLAILCIPKKAVKTVISQCGNKKVKAAIIITAGFKETGENGKQLEDEIIEIARTHKISLIGPNCLGVINTDDRIKLNATFSVSMPHIGRMALVSQSGAVGVAALNYTEQNELGISKFISIGNKAVIDESDVLEYLIQDELTDIITMYIEDITRPDHFLEMAELAKAKQKPIIAIKTGRSVQGAAAIHSHTGALSSSDTAYDALFEKAGVIRVTELEELFDDAKAFSCNILPKGKSVAVMTNAGGMGIIATDAIERNQLEMAKYEEGTLKKLKEVLPEEASIHNPLDVIGDADAQRIQDALAILIKDKNIDALIVSIVPTIKTNMEEVALNICEIAKENPTIPVLTNLMSAETNPNFEKILEKAHIPNFQFPEINVHTLGVMVKYQERLKKDRAAVQSFDVDKKNGTDILNVLTKENRSRLSEPESYGILESYGLKVLDYKLAHSEQEAIEYAIQIGYPVVMKIVSPDILHKVDVGGVQVNLKNDEEVKKAFILINDNIKKVKPAPSIQGFLIQKFFKGEGVEIILGSNHVKNFGPLIMFGLGGTLVELFKDVAFRLAPLNKQDALDMIMETKGYQILKGFRGHAPYNIDSICNYILRFSQIVMDFPEIKEMDINPLKVLDNDLGLLVMDAKALLFEGKDTSKAKGKDISAPQSKETPKKGKS